MLLTLSLGTIAGIGIESLIQLFKEDVVDAVDQTFIDNPIGMVENSFGVFRNGVYSSLASTAYGKWGGAKIR